MNPEILQEILECVRKLLADAEGRLSKNRNAGFIEAAASWEHAVARYKRWIAALEAVK